MSSNNNNQRLSTLPDKAMVVVFTTKAPTQSKVDKRASQKLVEAYDAHGRTVKGVKQMWASDLMKEIIKLQRQARSYHYEKTTPTKTKGEALLKASEHPEYVATMKDFAAQMEQMVADLTRPDVYESVLKATAKAQGALFDRSEFPTPDELKDMFELSWEERPIQQQHHWMIDVAESDLRQLRRKTERQVAELEKEAKKHCYEVMLKSLLGDGTKANPGLISILDDPDKIFRDDTINKFKVFAEEIAPKNVMDDPEIAELACKLNEELADRNPQEIRDDKDLRKKKAEASKRLAEEISNKMQGVL